MIQSMTAFSRQQLDNELGSFTCEIRSINHRYLELTIRLPESLSNLEAELREQVKKKIKRGKVECFIRYQANAKLQNFALNDALIQKLMTANENILALTKVQNTLSSVNFLQWPNVLLPPTVEDSELLSNAIQALLEETLTDFQRARLREGRALQDFLLEHLSLMQTEIKKVESRLPNILIQQREKLLLRFKEAGISLNPDRLEQEMVLQAQKIDVLEELVRLNAHIQEVQNSLSKKAAMGRRLDFLMQELNREANTLGSKSVDTVTTLASVELKVYIEQMREQVQNIE